MEKVKTLFKLESELAPGHRVKSLDLSTTESSRVRHRLFEDDMDIFVLPRLPLVDRYDTLSRIITVIRGKIKLIIARPAKIHPDIQSLELSLGQYVIVKGMAYIGWRSIVHGTIMTENSNQGYNKSDVIDVESLNIPSNELENIVPYLTIV